MSTLKDAANFTQELVELATQLHQELVEGDVEFERMVGLSDEIGERADALAQAFEEVSRSFAAQLSENGSSAADADG
jgi:hypothetical protein